MDDAFRNTIRELGAGGGGGYYKKIKKGYYSQVLEIAWHTWGHTTSSQKEREKGDHLEFCFYWGSGWEPKISQTHYLLVNLKQKSWNPKHAKTKIKQFECSVTKISKTKEPQGERGLDLSLYI